jgi:hypothetical protein
MMALGELNDLSELNQLFLCTFCRAFTPRTSPQCVWCARDIPEEERIKPEPKKKK